MGLSEGGAGDASQLIVRSAYLSDCPFLYSVDCHKALFCLIPRDILTKFELEVRQIRENELKYNAVLGRKVPHNIFIMHF